MNDSFELEVVSQLPQFAGKVLKPWFLDGIDTIGVWGDEPFELKFRNNTGQKVQVRLSVDGTDVLTGKVAHTNTNNEGMWVIDAWGTMSLKAWPETNQKGRSFMFGKTADSVAAHTHGDLSNKGIIAAAVFTEAYKPYTPPVPYNRFRDDYWKGGGGIYPVAANYGRRSTFGGGYGASGGTFGGSDIAKGGILFDSRPAVNDPGVGAGQEITQSIGKAHGLVSPKLDRIVRVKYLWWDDVEAKLVKHGFTKSSDGHPTGFPGDREERLANLGSTPTMGVERRPLIQIQRFA